MDTDQPSAAAVNNSDPGNEPVPVDNAVSVHGQAGSVQAYTPSGDQLAIDDDGIDFGALFESAEYGPALAAETELQDGGESISLEEKILMADRHEPITVTDLFVKADAQNGPVWVITFKAQIGNDDERVAFLSQHEQRDSACEAIKHVISNTKRPVKNIMFHVAWWSQGNPFIVLRPWDGQIQTGLGASARPVNMTGMDKPGVPMPGIPGSTPSDAQPPTQLGTRESNA